MHFSINPPGPKTSAMLGEEIGDAEALTDGVMRDRSFPACYLNTTLAGRPESSKQWLLFGDYDRGGSACSAGFVDGNQFASGGDSNRTRANGSRAIGA